jgi:hypothetical protein
VYSDQNVIRNVEIEGNRLSNTRGISIQASCCGDSANTIENVTVEDNEIQGSGQSYGLGVFAAASDPGNATHPSSGNTVSNMTIKNNNVTITDAREAGDALGGLYLVSGRGGARTGVIGDVHILNNIVDTGLIGIHLMGGIEEGMPGPAAAVGNAVSNIEVRGNVVAHAPTPGIIDYAGAKGIALTGGFGNTTGNSVKSVTIQGNTVAGVADDFSVRSNVEAGATGNLAALGTAQPTLTVTKSGGGSGSVSSNPAGIDCGSTCSYAFDDKSSVTLSATASAGASFTGWSGDCSGTGTCTVTMTPSRSVTATFETDKTLTVAKSGSGAGSVSSTPSGVDCGATCSHAFAHGTSVTLTATASAGSSFTGWSGACTGTGACTVTMDQARAATATFESDKTLTVSRSGHGQGAVTSSPPGIDCGATCSHAYPHGTAVTLSAAPGSRSTFAGWSGACTGKGGCMLDLSADRAVTATFNLLCVVPDVRGKRLLAAKRTILGANCLVGTVRKISSRKTRGTVIAQTPRPRTTHPEGTKVNLTVSKGKRA